MTKSKRFLALSVASLAGLVFAANLWAANFTVNCFDDARDATLGDTICASAGPCSDGTGLCTLRAAIQEANDPSVPGADVITLPAGTYTIQSFPCDDSDSNIGDFDITSFITINGAGAQNTIVDGNDVDRVFEVISSEPGDASATLRGMTIQNGLAGAVCQGSLGDGGGIRNFNASLILDRVAVIGNTAEDGGGIANSGTFPFLNSLSILNSTISGNDAVGDGELGGDGGGIFNDPESPETMPIVNSTISGNSARAIGGGIAHFNGTVQLRNVTITNNQANLQGFGSLGGGGVALQGFFQPPSLTLEGAPRAEQGIPELIVRNTIIAENIDNGVEDIAPDCLAQGFNTIVTTEGFNLIGADDFCGFPSAAFVDGVNGDQVGSETQPIDPLLGPLANNGGPNFTHALLTGSTAIDLANPAGCFANDANNGATLLIDQRGLTRPQDGNDDSNIRCDIGAFEVQPLCGNAIVNAPEECDDGNLTNGDGCASDCTIEPFCGDEAIDSGEDCDDGNTVDGDGCSADCSNEVVPSCGDGILQAGEECDGGDSTGGGCETDCTLSPFCGDGVKDADEECDDGNNSDADTCSTKCLDTSGRLFLLGGFGCSLAPEAVAGGTGLASGLSLMASAIVALLVKKRKTG